MMPVIPHFANECLEQLNTSNKDKWPIVEKDLLKKIEHNIVVQINGKKRDIFTINTDLNEREILENVINREKCSKYLEKKEIKKTIYVKNKLINIIIRRS